MSQADTAVSRFEDGFSCAQAVFMTLAEKYDIDKELACRIAAGFGGGMGRMGGTCGAVTGAYLALGLEFGGSGNETKAKTYEQVQEFAKRFKERSGATECRDLLGCDISTPEGMAVAKEGPIPEVCPKAVQNAVQIFEELAS